MWSSKHVAVVLVGVGAWALIACEPFAFFATNNPCEDDSNCPITDQCLAGVCVSALYTGESCTVNEDCSDGQGCNNLGDSPDFLCYPLSADAECTADDGCTDGFVCWLGSCTDPELFAPDNCTWHEDCPGSFCIPNQSKCASPAVYGTSLVTDDYLYIGDEDALADLQGYDTIVSDYGIYVGTNASSNPAEIDVATIDLGSVTTVFGDLYIQNQDTATVVSGDNLKTIRGSLYIQQNNAVTTISFPALEEVQEYYADGSPGYTSLDISENRQLETVSLPSLQTLASFTLDYNSEGDGATFPAPLTLSAPGLTDLTYFSVGCDDPCPGVGTFDLQGLTSVTNSLDMDFPVLPDVALFPHLVEVGGRLWLRDLNGPTTLSFPELVSVGGDTWGLTVANSSTLTTLSAPLLTAVTGPIEITYNDALSTLSLPMLTDVSTFDISGNPMLDTCVVEDLADQCGLPPADYTNDNNLGEPSTCS